MGRIIGGVVLGYLVMSAVVIGVLTGGFLALGADRVFRPGTYEVSPLWIALWLLVGIASGLLGGVVCAAVGRSPRAPRALVVLVLLLGAIAAIPAFSPPAGEAEPRTGAVSLEAMTKLKEPIWMALLNPIIGGAGVLAGARLRKPPAA